MLPNTDSPEAFGQHPNADIASQITEARTLFETLLSLQPKVSLSPQKYLNLGPLTINDIFRFPQEVEVKAEKIRLWTLPQMFFCSYRIRLITKLQQKCSKMIQVRSMLSYFRKSKGSYSSLEIKTSIQYFLKYLYIFPRYNQLLGVIKTSLEDLKKAILGLVVMSGDLEEAFNCIYETRVPPLWENAFSSLKPLAAWTRDLVLRIEQVN